MSLWHKLILISFHEFSHNFFCNLLFAPFHLKSVIQALNRRLDRKSCTWCMPCISNIFNFHFCRRQDVLRRLKFAWGFLSFSTFNFLSCLSSPKKKMCSSACIDICCRNTWLLVIVSMVYTQVNRLLRRKSVSGQVNLWTQMKMSRTCSWLLTWGFIRAKQLINPRKQARILGLNRYGGRE